MPKNKPNVFDGQAIAANEFFKTHWQRSPYLFKQTAIPTDCLPGIDELFELAKQIDVQSRIVYSEDGKTYQAVYDEPEAWQQLQPHKPTLLVSDIEKWFPAAMHIMSWFPFIKNWRFDDLMMSYAPKGASVGAHTDHYDVFLLQVRGTRQWSYDLHPDHELELVDDSELAVIKDYLPATTQELHAGDVLYLPPEIAHHGISTSDDCITCSIGLRAPSETELLTSVLELMTQGASPKERFLDGVDQTFSDASIGPHEINYLRRYLNKMAQMKDAALAELFGQVVTSYRLFDEHNHHAKQDSEAVAYWQKSPFAVFAYHVETDHIAQLFVNGELLMVSPSFAQTVCDEHQFKQPPDHADVFSQLIKTHAVIAK